MRQERRRGRAQLVPQQQEVEVERARCIGLRALAPELELDPLSDGEEVRRREVAPADGYGVEERWLRQRRDRFRQIDRRDDEGAEFALEPRERGLEDAPRVAEVAAQSERKPTW